MGKNKTAPVIEAPEEFTEITGDDLLDMTRSWESMTDEERNVSRAAIDAHLAKTFNYPDASKALKDAITRLDAIKNGTDPDSHWWSDLAGTIKDASMGTGRRAKRAARKLTKMLNNAMDGWIRWSNRHAGLSLSLTFVGSFVAFALGTAFFGLYGWLGVAVLAVLYFYWMGTRIDALNDHFNWGA